MELRILGSLEIRQNDEPLSPRRRMGRRLLAMLALRPNVVVRADWIVTGLWDGAPPASAAANLRSYLADLRRLFALGSPSGRSPALPSPAADRSPAASGRSPAAPDTPRDRIAIEATARGGYVLRVGPDSLDALRFDRYADQGRHLLAAGRYAAAVDSLLGALDLWRGPVLDGLAVPRIVEPEVRVLEDRRLDVLEDSVEARLLLGRHAELVAELDRLTDQFGLRERLWRQRMTALYRSGRRADALTAYRNLARLLDDELGVGPSPESRLLRDRMLRDDPGLEAAVSARAPVPPPAGPPVVQTAATGTAVWRPPRQLPPGPVAFVGRATELAALDDAMARTPHAVPVCVVTGTAGVGKTALAVHWAYRRTDRFPAGCLYLDLRGHGPGEPLSPVRALSCLVRELSLSGAAPPGSATPGSATPGGGAVPAGLTELTARYRTLTAGRPLLLVLDNAASAEQVRPLLPGDPHTAVLVTSRNDLAGLVAREGARRVRLELLDDGAAAELLRALVGTRVDDEPRGARTLAAYCAHLPLALRVAAELAASRPDDTLAGLAAELTDRRVRLDRLDAGGDPDTAVRAVFSWSYQQLTEPAARVFRLLGLHPGQDVDRYAVAALAGVDPTTAGRLLALLSGAHLLLPAGSGRYGMHDLLRAYAAELALHRDDPRDRDAALTRLFDHYLHRAVVAARTRFPYERDTLAVPPPVEASPDSPAVETGQPPVDPAAAQSWLDAELPNLIAVLAHTARHGPPRYVGPLATALHRHLLVGGRYSEAYQLHQHARAVAEETGDATALARALGDLGQVCHRLDRIDEALDLLAHALRLRDPDREPAAVVAILNMLGVVHSRRGEHQAALRYLRRALHLATTSGDQIGASRSTGNSGAVYATLGRYQTAIRCFRRALRLHERLGDRTGEIRALNYLGATYCRLGRYPEALAHLGRGLRVSREVAERVWECGALENLGVVNLRLGRRAEAGRQLHRALRMCCEFGDRAGEAGTLNRLGWWYRCSARYVAALEHHRRALAISLEIGDRLVQAEVLNDLGMTLRAAGRPRSARAAHESALLVADDTANRFEAGRALDGIARSHCDLGELSAAAAGWQDALAVYTALGVPEAADVRSRISRCASGAPGVSGSKSITGRMTDC